MSLLCDPLSQVSALCFPLLLEPGVLNQAYNRPSFLKPRGLVFLIRLPASCALKPRVVYSHTVVSNLSEETVFERIVYVFMLHVCSDQARAFVVTVV